jgi:hypothetical protein
VILDALAGKATPSVADYRIALSTMIGLVAMALLMAHFSKETHCRPLYERSGTLQAPRNSVHKA